MNSSSLAGSILLSVKSKWKLSTVQSSEQRAGHLPPAAEGTFGERRKPPCLLLGLWRHRCAAQWQAQRCTIWQFNLASVCIISTKNENVLFFLHLQYTVSSLSHTWKMKPSVLSHSVRVHTQQPCSFRERKPLKKGAKVHFAARTDSQGLLQRMKKSKILSNSPF